MLRVAASVTTNGVTLCEGAGVGRVKPQDPVFWRLTPSRWNTTFGSISLCSIGPDHYFITQPPLCAPWWCKYYITGVPPESGKVPPTTESSDRRVQTSDGTRFGFRPLSCTFITVDETGCTDGTVCSWPSAGSVPIAVVTAQCERCDSTSKKFCAAGWWKVAKSPETTSGRNGGRQQERQSRARSKRPCETELSWQGSLKRCTFPARLIEAVSVFCFFQVGELPPDYRGTAVHPLPPDSACAIMRRVTTTTNAQLRSSRSSEASAPFWCSFHFTDCHSFRTAINETKPDTTQLQRQRNIY